MIHLFSRPQSRIIVRLVLLFSLLFTQFAVLVGPASALPPIDPYADAVDATTTGLILSANSAVGAPDGTSATIVGLLGQSLTLDMGVGEEGTRDLIVHYTGLAVGVQATVQFLDASHTVIASGTANLANIAVGNHSTVVAYTSSPTPYRYVRFTSLLSAYFVDAIEEVSAPTPDFYADAVDSTTGALILNASNAVGAPDGTNATVVGIVGQNLVLDMGLGEEGTRNLTVYYGGLTVGVQVQVEFLNASHAVIASGTANLADLTPGTHSTVVAYTSSPTPYRYVRFASLAAAYLIDAIEDTPLSGPDPYADAVDSASGLILTPSNAIGAPDGATATVVGIQGQNLVLDMGQGEEGTGDLTVYYGGISTGVQVQVEFLDANHAVIASGTANLADLTPGIHSTVVTYNNAPTLYRYVRLTSLASAYLIDAIEAQTYFIDSDGDGLPDDWENQYGLDPNDPTGDNGAAGDPDNDGLTNLEEYINGTNPHDSDTDNDGLPDGWEVDHNLDPNDATGDDGATGDPDNDGLTNLEEYTNGTDPHDSDTDNDGLPDGWEVDHNLDPNDATGDDGATGDPDNDGLTNLEEYTNGTDPHDADTDNDGLNDGDEIDHGTDPLDPDTDNDGLPDGWEVDHGLDPLNPNGDDGADGDPDGDGIPNDDEYNNGTDPQVPNTTTYSLSPGSGSTISLSTRKGINTTTSITVTNTGNSLLHVTSVTLTGSSAISRTSPSSFTVTAHSSAKITFLCNATNVGTFSANVSLASDAAAAPNTFTITCNVRDALALTSASPTAGIYGHTYGYTFISNSAGPLTYTITAGSLPPGLTLAPNGTLSGRPTAVGAYNATVTVRSATDSQSQTFTVLVNKAPLTIKANNNTKALYTQNPPLTFSYSGFVNGDTASALSGAPVCSTTATTTSGAGTYPITCTKGSLASNSYTFTSTPGTLTIKPQLMYIPMIMSTPNP